MNEHHAPSLAEKLEACDRDEIDPLRPHAGKERKWDTWFVPASLCRDIIARLKEVGE